MESREFDEIARALRTVMLMDLLRGWNRHETCSLL